jgi:hypothetical protein
MGLPSALYLAALAVIAKVGDSLMDCTRCDKTVDAELLKMTSLGVQKNSFLYKKHYFTQKSSLFTEKFHLRKWIEISIRF